MAASIGSIGDAFDNAMAEMEVFSFIEGFYNLLRRHSRLGNLSPAVYEQQLTTQTEMSS
jgi:putative transposase